jgi:2-polyprenyl-3-methyl-5-hydroxy-6-metoxy-1,4-benzoquinol methylase
VIGIDMTEEQIKTARKYIDYHTKKFGYDDKTKTIEFKQGYIEDLKSAGIADESVDVIV